MGVLPVLLPLLGLMAWRTWRDDQRLERHRREDQERWEGEPHASHDCRRSLRAIVDHFIRNRGFHWPISLPVIDPQRQTLWQTLKTDEAGVIVHHPPGAGALDPALCLPIHPL